MTKRVGNNLVLFFDGEDTADVILEDYYENDEVHLIGQAENGQYYEYIPVSGDVNEYAPMLMDGGSGEAALGGEPSAFADPIADDNQFAWLPFLLFGAGAAGIGGLAYAAFKDKDSKPADDHEISIVINPATDKDKDGRPEITGSSSSPDSKVVITLPDGTTVTTQTDKEGNWAIEAPTSQPNGIITVTVTDSDGNSSTVTGKYEDNTAPEKPVISANDDDHLAGTAEPGSKVTVTDKETGETTTVVADEDGKWSIEPNPVAEGGNEATVVAEDPAGNVSPPVDVTRPDTTVPDNISSGIVKGSISLVDDVAPVTGVIADGSKTNDTRPTYTGKATGDIDHVNIYDNGKLVGSAKVGSDGRWSFTPKTSLAEGSTHEYTVAAVDKAGNEGARVSGTNDAGWTFTIDTLPPDNKTSGIVVDSITLVDDVAPVTGLIKDGDKTNDTRPTYSGKATGDIDHVNIYDNGKLVASVKVNSDGTWSYTPEKDLANGSSHEYSVSAIDQAGNEGPRASGTSDSGWNFVIDSDTPDNITSGIVDGSLSLTDDVGAITGNIPDGGVTDDSRPTFSGQATEDIDHVNIYDDGKLIGSAEVAEDGRWSFTPETDLAEGDHEFTVSAVDKAGNEGPQTSGTSDDGWNFTVDTTAPGENAIVDGSITLTDDVGPVTGTIADGSTTDDTQPTYSGVISSEGLAEGVVSVNVYDNGELIGSAVVDQSTGAWSFTPDSDLASGSHGFTVAAVDAAGNEGPQVSGTSDDSWDFTLDNSAPGENAFESGSITLIDDVGPVQGTIDDGSTTDDSQPTYSGIISSEGLADGVVSVNVYDNGELIGSAAVDQSTGTWSFTPGNPLASGNHTFTVAAVDAAGNEGPQVSGTDDAGWDFNLLTSAPAQPSIENVSDDYTHGENADTGFLQKGQATNDSTPTINGSAGPDMKVQIWATDSEGNRVLAGEGVADENGRWSITTSELGADGTYNLTATAVNAAGVSSAETGIFPIVLDTAAPEAAKADLMDDQGDVQGAVAAGGVTDDRNPQLSGTGEPGATVDVFLDGATTPAGSVVVGEDGNWTLALANLSDGEHSYQTRITDAAGNETRGEEVSFTVDSSSMTITIDQANDDAGSITGAVMNGGLTDDSTPELQGTTQAGAIVTIRDAEGNVLGTATADDAGVWKFPLTEVADGEHTWTAEVTNKAGNTVQANLTLTVDATAPEAAKADLMDDQGEVQGTVAAGGVTDDRTPQLNGTGEPGATVTVIVDGASTPAGSVVVGEDGNWTLPLGTLDDGEHSYQTVITDAAGNETRGEEVSFTVDSSSVEITIDQANDDAGSITGAVLNGGLTDDSTPELQGTTLAGATVTIRDAEGNVLGTATADSAGAWKFPLAEVADGEHTWTAEVTNTAGNTAQATLTLTVDTTAPEAAKADLMDDQGEVQGAVAAGGVTDDRTPQLNGTGEPGATVTVIVDGASTPAGSVVVDKDGNWTLPLGTLDDGEHSYQTIITDAAGNETRGEEVGFTVDSSGAAITIDQANDDAGSITGAVLNGGLTDDSTPELQGTTLAGATVTIRDAEGNVLGTTSADDAGVWKFQLAEVADGEHTWTAEVTNKAGNTAQATLTLTVDSTAPAAPTITSMEDDVGTVQEVWTTPGNVTDDPAPTFIGTAEAGTTINLYDGDNVLGTVVADKDGNWSYTPTTNLVDGEHSISVTSTDAAGNESERSTVWDFTLDTSTTAPVIITNTTGEIGGTAEPGATITITNPSDGSTASVVADEDGNWSMQPNPIGVGDTDVAVVATDPAGNTNSTVVDGPQDNTAPGADAFEDGSITLIDDVGPVKGTIDDGSTTDDAQPTYSGLISSEGLADGVVSVNVYDNGELIGSAAVDQSTGAWSFTPGSALASGSHTFTVAAVDAAGNEGPQVSGTADEGWDFNLLTSAPAQPSIENVVDDYSQGEDPDTGFLQKGQATNDATPTINGTGEAGTTVQIWATDSEGNRVLAGEGVADENGRWSITTSELGADGTYNLTATAVNAAGVSSAETGVFPIVLDTVAPEAATAELLDDQGEVQGAVAAGGVTDDRTPQLSGTGEPGATVTVYLDGATTPAGSVVVGEDGKWSLPLGTLDDGEHSYQTKITDVAGNETRGEEVGFTVDGSGVEITIDQANDDAGSITGAVLNGGLTDDSTPELQGTTLAGAIVTIRDAQGNVLGTATADNNGMWKYQLAEVADGEHTWTAEVTNTAGNTAQATLTLTVDTTAPATPTITSMEDDVGTVQEVWTTPGNVTDDPAPTFTGTATPGTVVSIYDGDNVLGTVTADNDGNWNYTLTTNLVDGEHNISVTSTDAAGNESERSTVWDFTLDTSTTAPVIITNTTDEIGGTAEPGATITITDPSDGSTSTAVADEEGNWSMQPNPIGVGDTDVAVVATDPAGNTNSTIVDGPQDSTPPDNITSGIVSGSITLTDDVELVTGSIADGSKTNDTRPTYAGQATADIDHVNIYDKGTLIGSAEVGTDGRWSFTPETDLAEGDYEFTVSAVDKAGNEGPQVSGTADSGWNFTVDTTAPGENAFESGSITLIDDVGPVKGTIDDGSTTDDAQPTYSGVISSEGLADGVVSVNVYDNGELIGSAAVDQSTGAWSFTPGSALASGSHTFTVAAVDAAGNEGPQVSGTADAGWDFNLLTSAPAQPSIENVVDDYTHGEDADTGFLQKGQVTNDGTLTVNGSAGPDMTVQIWATDSEGNRVLAGEGVADENGRWSITTAELGADGAYDLTATAVNAAGVSSAETGAFPIVLDTEAPEAATAELLDDQGEVQGAVAAGGVTDDRTPQLSGTGEPGATVTVYLDGATTPAGSVVVGEDGNWTLALANLSDGEHSYQTKIADAAGNETRGEEISFTVDGSGVDITIDQANDDAGSITGAVLNGGLTDDNTPELQGTTLAGATVTIRDAEGNVLGTATADGTGAWKFPLTEVADGEHTWTAEVTNLAGNTAQATLTLTVDTTAPQAPVITAIQDDVGSVQFTSQVQGNVTDDPAPTFTGTAEAGTTITLYDGENVLGSVVADKDGNWNYTPTTNLVEGTHSVTATATDAAGNVSESSAKWDFLLDITPPNVGISGNSAESLSGMSEPGATITVIDGAGKEFTTVADHTGRWIIAPNPIEAGVSGKIYATDPAGNQGDPVAFQGAALGSYNLLNESTQVNTTTVGDQANPTTTRLADGRIVVIWQGAGTSATEVYMQLYAADGVHKIGTEQQVNQRTNNFQDSPQVVALADGGFLIVYESWNGGLDSNGDGVIARRYGSDGQAVTDEFVVNTTTSGNQNSPSAMATPDGGYIITWQDQSKNIVQRTYGNDNQPETGEVVVATGSNMGASGGPEMASFTDGAHSGMYITVWNASSGPSDSSSTGVVGQIFGADGKPLGNAFQVNTTMDGSQNYPDVITLKDGSFVVYWDSNDSGANGSDIRAVHYTVDPATGAVSVQGTGDFIVNTYTDGKQYKPVGVALEDGGYLIVWGSAGGDGSGSAIYAQRYDANDNKVGREFIVNTTTNGNQGYGGDTVDLTHILDATLMADGNVYVSWQSDNVDGSGMGIEGIVVDPNAAYYSEFTVNSTTAGNQNHSSVASLPDGGSIVVWQSATGDGSGTCIKGQILDAKGQPVGGEFTVNSTTSGDQLMPQVAVLPNGDFEVLWSSGVYIKGQKFSYTYDGDSQISGATMSGSEFNINSGTAADNQSNPVITVLADGGYLAVWQAAVNGVWQVFGRQYDMNGSPVMEQTVLTTTTLNSPTIWNAFTGDWNPLPSITTLSDGRVAIAYTNKGTGYDATVMLYDPATKTTTTSIVVNQTLSDNQASPVVTALGNGNFIVTWDSNNNGGPDQTGFGVWGRLFDSEGHALSDEFLINTATAGDQHMPIVVSREDGSFVVVFVSATDGAPGAGTHGIYAQYFDADGNKVGQQMQINQLTYGDQIEVDATFLAGGQLYVTWTDQGVADGAGSAIKGRIVDLVETLGLEQETAKNDDPTTIDYSPSAEAVVDSLPPNVGISVNNSDRLGGQTEPGATVTVIDAKGNSHVAVADAKGAWHLEPNPLGVGDKGYISASDAAGNQGVPILIRGTALDGYDLLNESTQVNTTTAGDQANPTVTRLADGRIVVIWQSNDGSVLLPDNNVYMQLYEADGVHKIGTEQQVNQRTNNNQDSPQVVALADGGFLVVYESWNGGLDSNGDGIIARRYGSDGQVVTDEFVVNTTTSGNQNNPSVLATPDGGYIITWQDQSKNIVQRTYGNDNQPETGEVVVATGNNMGASGGPEMASFTDGAHSGMYITVWNASSGPSDSSSTGVVGQIFGADGKPLGNAFQVNTTMDGSQNYPDVITLKDGSFVVYWDSNDSGANGSDIRAVHYTVDPATGAVSVQGTGDFIVNTYTDGKQYKPVGVALEDGGYLIVWGSAGGDGSGSAIYAQRYDAHDHKVGREFIVNTTTNGNQGYVGDGVDLTHILDATLMADGNVYISWQSDNVDGSGMGIEGIVVDPNAAYYSEFTVNSTTAGDQNAPMVVSLPTGGLFEVWVSANGDGSGTGIRGQMLDAKGQPVGNEFTINSTVTGNQLTPVVLENGNIGVVWSSPASGGANYIKGQQYTYTYDSDGNVNGLTAVGPEFNISSGAGATGQAHPEITSLSDGGYLVVWEAIVNDEYKIFARQYGEDGSPVSGEMTLSSTGLGVGIFGNSNFWSPLPSVSQTSDGKVAIVFATGGSGYDSSLLMYDPVTHTAGSAAVVNQTVNGDQASASVSALDNGNFVVTWDSNNKSGPDQNGYGVWGRIYDASGQAVSNEFLINTVTVGDQHLAQVVSRADGSFVAVFISATDTAPGAGTNGIYAQYFDAHGNKVGQQMQINQLTYGNQVEVDATFMEGGQLYVTWTDKGVGDGSGSAIKGRIVDLNETLGLSDDGDGLTHIEYQPAQYYLNGTEGDDSLDGRGAITIDGKGGDDTLFINSTDFTSIKGGDGYDTLVWDSNNNFELGSVSSKISSIEGIHMGNNAAQTLVISANDVLEMTKDNGETEHVLKITGDDGDSNKSGAKDTVNIDKSVWTSSGSQTEKGVDYDVYVHNDDTTVKLIIQNGLNVV
ncbi:Ig-like domain-containing protein [Enterobacteriaceae bacterium H20N1]|uniref:Ig-like domain-containing protein n=1 Tax=Dryocola boscaweniae TaxID=2925397 RepID=A0A9X2WBZ3_9ENTR|nr:Ig-like domain-containing protein [Dryocola boscaweniae]MCT4703349.1 Ig-like domain-containing protein [Dryocola boscaweniae]MCT4720517.1 Ig-like domain-containing protein [Dryocola boscaweniae]